MSAKPLRALPKTAPHIDVPVVGWICGFDPQRGLLVDFPQRQSPALVAARWTMPLDIATLETAISEQRQVVMIFEEGDPERPIVTGILEPLELRKTAPAAPSPSTNVVLPDAPTEARLDGKRVVLEAQDELVLRCGSASLILRKNGSLLLKGAYVLSHSSGVNRIRGGSVQIN